MKNLGFLGFDMYAVTKCGKVYSLHSNRYLKPQVTHGYLRVCLNKKLIQVHRLVAYAYIPNPENKPQVNHIDGNKSNNDVSNLEWVTASENIQHAHDTKLTAAHNKSLDSEKVHSICRCLQDGLRVCDVATMHGVSLDIVSDIKRKRCYKEITEDYDFSSSPKTRTLSTDKIISVCELLQKGTKQSDIVKSVGVSLSFIDTIKRRKRHTHISSNYKW